MDKNDGAASLVRSDALLAVPFSCEHDECGGYDCMSGGWHVKNAAGTTLVTVDEADFDEKKDAETVARFIVCTANAVTDFKKLFKSKDT